MNTPSGGPTYAAKKTDDSESMTKKPAMYDTLRLRFVVLTAMLALNVAGAGASQIDIVGPPGSVAFGSTVAVLPNGNIVVVDFDFAATGASNAGAVYLYDPQGNLISTLTGSHPNDYVGINGVTLVGNGNFVVSSPQWNNSAGAVTWVNGATGLSDVVSSGNSLVGSSSFDQVGGSPPTAGGILVLNNGNYVVGSPSWNNCGAATWADGKTGITGTISASNSMIGTAVSGQVGHNITALNNGNYVVGSPYWNGNHGAATWGNGTTGSTGTVSAANSLVGASGNDYISISGITALGNGNYVVASYGWNGNRGAATWSNGTTGITGAVSTGNSLVGSAANDLVGYSVTALSNGNYVVRSPYSFGNAGAATWGDGATGVAGTITASNSLVGAAAGDNVGSTTVTALSNGNYVVGSPSWNGKIGAATWGNGSTGTTGVVSASNSLVGAFANDQVSLTGVVSFNGITALSNGNYVVGSPHWNGDRGAATWGNGTTGSTGIISASNSLVGASANDQVSRSGITALSNGNYVVSSEDWSGGGAATFGDGGKGTAGIVSSANSLVGGGLVSSNGIAALSNGNYVVASQYWHGVGAATWGNGDTGVSGAISFDNSLVGQMSNDRVGNVVAALSDGNYVVSNPFWSGGKGAITVADGKYGLRGSAQPWNSVVGASFSSGSSLNFSYDASLKRLAVGKPADKLVSLLVLDDTISENGFE